MLDDLLCISVWSGSLVYSLWRFIIASTYNQYLLDPSDFINGSWVLPQKSKDVSDHEWSVLSTTFRDYFYIFIAYIVFSCTSQSLSVRLKSIGHFIFGTIAATSILNFASTIFLLANVLIALLIHRLKTPSVAYLYFFTSLILIHKEPGFYLKEYLFGYDSHKILLFDVSTAWLQAKCLSFIIDRLRHSELPLQSDLVVLSYCFYFPVFFTGPIHQFKDFVKDLHKPNPSYVQSLPSLAANLLRYVFWGFVLEILLHFVYSSSMQYYPEVAENLDGWTLCGLGYALPVLFHIKYLAIYGIANSLAALDNVKLPPPPECVSRIHSNTHLWRTFDRGLHLWLTTYIYKPIVGNQWTFFRRVVAAAFCFACVCLWHGFDSAVVLWCGLNFFGIILEMAFEYLWYIMYPTMRSGSFERRAKAIASAPLYASMIVSNIFFLSNWNLGCVFVKRILLSFPIPLIPTLLIMYCGCRVSMLFKEKKLQSSSKML